MSIRIGGEKGLHIKIEEQGHSSRNIVGLLVQTVNLDMGKKGVLGL